jgi:hypothetical protein
MIHQGQAISKQKLISLLTHVKNGTLYSRFKQWRKEQKHQRRIRLWNNATATQGIVAYRLETGATLQLYSDDTVSREIFVNDFEANERAFVRRYLGPGDIFVDVGANIGLFTACISMNAMPNNGGPRSPS